MKIGRNEYYLIILLALYVLLFIWSFNKPFDLSLWVYEVAPALIGTICLVVTYSKFVFTRTTYTWCFIAACLMTVGGHYSYSLVPLFEWLKDIFSWDRNNYDKLGHVVQGIVPVLIIREVLVRKLKLTHVFLVNMIALFISLGISALYEIIEWSTIFVDSRVQGDFLGEQGYRWDSQSDMLMAMLGGGFTILLGRKNMKLILSLVNFNKANK